MRLIVARNRKEGEMDTLESRIMQSCEKIDMRKIAGIAKIARYGKGFEDIDWDISYCDEESPDNGIRFVFENNRGENDCHVLSVSFWAFGWTIEENRIFEIPNEKRGAQNEGMKYETNNRFLFTSHLTKAIKRLMDHINKY